MQTCCGTHRHSLRQFRCRQATLGLLSNSRLLLAELGRHCKNFVRNKNFQAANVIFNTFPQQPQSDGSATLTIPSFLAQLFSLAPISILNILQFFVCHEAHLLPPDSNSLASSCQPPGKQHYHLCCLSWVPAVATLLTSQDLFSRSSAVTGSPCPSLQSLHELPAKKPIAILLSSHSCVDFCMCILVRFKALSFISADATVSRHPLLSESYSLCAKELNITASPFLKVSIMMTLII